MGKAVLIQRYPSVSRDITALSIDYPAGYLSPLHFHDRCQLLYAMQGVMNVKCNAGVWVVPPERALWLPAGMEHRVYCRGHVSLRSIYIKTGAIPNMPDSCKVILVSPLLRELLAEAISIPAEYDLSGRDGRVMALILDELRITRTLPLQLTMPTDARLRRVCDMISKDPGRRENIDFWADMAGLSRRTFTRRFKQETRMSFVEWRHQICLFEALSRLAEGEFVTTVALDLGYQSTSAFTFMFRRILGTTPTKYFGS